MKNPLDWSCRPSNPDDRLGPLLTSLSSAEYAGLPGQCPPSLSIILTGLFVGWLLISPVRAHLHVAKKSPLLGHLSKWQSLAIDLFYPPRLPRRFETTPLGHVELNPVNRRLKCPCTSLGLPFGVHPIESGSAVPRVSRSLRFPIRNKQLLWKVFGQENAPLTLLNPTMTRSLRT